MRSTSRALVLAFAALSACKGSDAYSHMAIDVGVEGLTPAQRKQLDHIEIRSQAKGNEDPSRVHGISITADDLDSDLAYHTDYIPDPQKGTFVVDALLLDKNGEQLAIKSQDVEVGPGKKGHVAFDFVSEVSTDGDCRVEGDAVEITPGASGGDSFTFLWDEDHYLMIYTDDTQGNGDLFSVKLDASGAFLSDPVSLNNSNHVSMLPSVVKVDTGYVVAWQEGTKDDNPPVAVQLRLLDADGAPVGNTRQVPTTSVEARPILEVAYGRIAMAWIDDLGTFDAPAREAMVGFMNPDDLSFVDGSPISVSGGIGENSFPAIAMTDDKLAVSWVGDDASVYGATIDDALQLSTPVQLYSSTYVAQQLDVVSVGSEFFTAWEDLSGDLDKGRERIRGAFTTMDGEVGAGGIVHEIDTGSANWPRMAWNGDDNVAVVYYQYRDFGAQIYLTRYSPNGERIDGEDYEFTNVAGQAKYPDIKLRDADFDGADHYGLGWVDDHTGVARVYFQPVVCDAPE